MINGSSKKGGKIDRLKINKCRCGLQFGPDQRVRQGGHLEGMKRGRTASFKDRWMIVAKDAKLLKMLILN